MFLIRYTAAMFVTAFKLSNKVHLSRTNFYPLTAENKIFKTSYPMIPREKKSA